MNTDPYAVLGLSPGASDDEVKAAYAADCANHRTGATA